MPLKRIATGVTSASFYTGASEVVLRQFFGNLALAQLFQFRPGGGRCVALKPRSSVQYTGHRLRTAPVTQEVNAQGFRDETVPEDRNEPSLRIAVLGDSFTYGVGVVEKDMFAAEMGRLLRESRGMRYVEVINFGVPSLNMDEVSLHYDAFVLRWKPDVALWFMWHNDLDALFCDRSGHMAATDGLGSFANRLVLFAVVAALVPEHAQLLHYWMPSRAEVEVFAVRDDFYRSQVAIGQPPEGSTPVNVRGRSPS